MFDRKTSAHPFAMSTKQWIFHLANSMTSRTFARPSLDTFLLLVHPFLPSEELVIRWRPSWRASRLSIDFKITHTTVPAPPLPWPCLYCEKIPNGNSFHAFKAVQFQWPTSASSFSQFQRQFDRSVVSQKKPQNLEVTEAHFYERTQQQRRRLTLSHCSLAASRQDWAFTHACLCAILTNDCKGIIWRGGIVQKTKREENELNGQN